VLALCNFTVYLCSNPPSAGSLRKPLHGHTLELSLIAIDSLGRLPVQGLRPANVRFAYRADIGLKMNGRF
jgi:hypothetical protein